MRTPSQSRIYATVMWNNRLHHPPPAASPHASVQRDVGLIPYHALSKPSREASGVSKGRSIWARPHMFLLPLPFPKKSYKIGGCVMVMLDEGIQLGCRCLMAWSAQFAWLCCCFIHQGKVWESTSLTFFLRAATCVAVQRPFLTLREPLSCVLSPSNGLENLNGGFFVWRFILVWSWDMPRLLGMVHPIKEHGRVDSRWNPRNGLGLNVV